MGLLLNRDILNSIYYMEMEWMGFAFDLARFECIYNS